MIATTFYKSRNYIKEREGEANLTTENTKGEEKLEEYNHYIEEYPSSKPNLLIDNVDDYAIKSNIDCDDSSPDVSLVMKKDKYGDIYEWYVAYGSYPRG
jgi:hypothetical protein